MASQNEGTTSVMEAKDSNNTGEVQPNEAPKAKAKVSSTANNKPFTLKLEVDLMQIGLFVLALLTRTWQLGLPRAVVFDELHFAKFASLYINRIFFFDIHPPLGKMMLALAGSYSGFKGDIGFDRIGQEYHPQYPVYILRLIPAVSGSLVVPLVYQIVVELGFTRWAALLAGAFILLDNALLVQSRFMLMEGMLLCFLCLALLSFLKFRHLSHRQFSLQWWFWLCLTGVSFSLALSVKYVGFFTGLLLVYMAFKDFWKMLGDVALSDLGVVKHLLARLTMLLVLPALVYVYVFYVHLSILTKAGPHDNVMTSAFQASLEGGLATLTKGQPLHVAYGSQITLRHTFDPSPGNPCWLHSHEHVYPVRYPDGRGSSHQQQVTCYIYKDVNNWWIIKHPDREDMTVSNPPEPVKHGDVIQLVHGLSSRALNSHDVAAPVSPQLQEVSCYINYNVSMPPQNLWRVEIVNSAEKDQKWETIKSHVQLVHVSTNQALKISGKQLPEWGFGQLEVATDRVLQQQAAIWNVEEHKYTRSPDKNGQIADLTASEMFPLEPTKLSFWSKFWELQAKMLLTGHDEEMEHKYSSSPLDWPFMAQNVAYWMSGRNNAQVHLVGNLVVWAAGTMSLVIYAGFFVFYLLRRRRDLFDLTQDEWSKFIFVGDLVVVGYLIHYLPHFMTDRTLFLHHYLPCVIFKVLAVAAVVNHVDFWLSQVQHGTAVIHYIIVVLLAIATWVFLQLSAVSYGSTDLTPELRDKITWRQSWDFLLHQKP